MTLRVDDNIYELHCPLNQYINKRSLISEPVTNSWGWSWRCNMIFEKYGVNSRMETCIMSKINNGPNGQHKAYDFQPGKKKKHRICDTNIQVTKMLMFNKVYVRKKM